jgi:hypothetical protein
VGGVPHLRIGRVFAVCQVYQVDSREGTAPDYQWISVTFPGQAVQEPLTWSRHHFAVRDPQSQPHSHLP